MVIGNFGVVSGVSTDSWDALCVRQISASSARIEHRVAGAGTRGVDRLSREAH